MKNMLSVFSSRASGSENDPGNVRRPNRDKDQRKEELEQWKKRRELREPLLQEHKLRDQQKAKSKPAAVSPQSSGVRIMNQLGRRAPLQPLDIQALSPQRAPTAKLAGTPAATPTKFLEKAVTPTKCLEKVSCTSPFAELCKSPGSEALMLPTTPQGASPRKTAASPRKRHSGPVQWAWPGTPTRSLAEDLGSPERQTKVLEAIESLEPSILPSAPPSSPEDAYVSRLRYARHSGPCQRLKLETLLPDLLRLLDSVELEARTPMPEIQSFAISTPTPTPTRGGRVLLVSMATPQSPETLLQATDVPCPQRLSFEEDPGPAVVAPGEKAPCAIASPDGQIISPGAASSPESLLDLDYERDWTAVCAEEPLDDATFRRCIQEHQICWTDEVVPEMGTEDWLSRAPDLETFWYFERREQVAHLQPEEREELETVVEYPESWPRWRVSSLEQREAMRRDRMCFSSCSSWEVHGF